MIDDHDSDHVAGAAQTSTTRIFHGDGEILAIPADSRAFAYGDGLFETMRAHRGSLPWWPRHWARLVEGASRLRIALPEEQWVRREAKALLDGGDGVLKLVVSRGAGGRGYSPRESGPACWMLSRHDLPAVAEDVTLRWCQTRLAEQPALAGMKHCNRLEQVLARSEWLVGRDDGEAVEMLPFDEGLMLSTRGDVVSATAANLFVHVGGRWVTPLLDRCGIAGVCRGWLLEQIDVEQGRLLPAQVETADALFLCNAVRGILPVSRLGARTWSSSFEVMQLQRRLAESHPAFASLEVP